MSKSNSLKLGLITWTLTMCFVAGCSKENKGSDHEGEPAKQVGALDPKSVEAVALLEGPWCMQDTNARGRVFEMRYAFRDNGTVYSKSYKFVRGTRAEQAGETLENTWALDASELTWFDEKYDVKETVTVSFTYEDNVRYMTLNYEDGAETYYGCP